MEFDTGHLTKQDSLPVVRKLLVSGSCSRQGNSFDLVLTYSFVYRAITSPGFASPGVANAKGVRKS